jgi:putative FmdB family regulatory protein
VPLYDYHCKNCGETFDEFRPMDKRYKCKCPTCGKQADKLLNTTRLDYYNMGVDPALPTAVDKWDKMHRKEARRKSD